MEQEPKLVDKRNEYPYPITIHNFISFHFKKEKRETCE